MKQKKKQSLPHKSAKHRRMGFYETLNDLVVAFNALKDASGWILHQYRNWICFAVHSTEFEDPDIKVIVKSSLEYKIIIAGLLLDRRLPSLRTNELESVLNHAELALKNICCGFKVVAEPDKFCVYHRRYSYDVFAAHVEKPKYESVYRSPFCVGHSAKGPCSFCYKLNVETLQRTNRYVHEIQENGANAKDADHENAEKSVLHKNNLLLKNEKDTFA